MDPDSTIDRLASGEATMVLATCVVALAIAVVVLFHRLTTQQDKRIEDLRNMGEKMANAIHENNKALAALTEPMREAVRELRGRK